MGSSIGGLVETCTRAAHTQTHTQPLYQRALLEAFHRQTGARLNQKGIDKSLVSITWLVTTEVKSKLETRDLALHIKAGSVERKL